MCASLSCYGPFKFVKPDRPLIRLCAALADIQQAHLRPACMATRGGAGDRGRDVQAHSNDQHLVYQAIHSGPCRDQDHNHLCQGIDRVLSSARVGPRIRDWDYAALIGQCRPNNDELCSETGTSETSVCVWVKMTRTCRNEQADQAPEDGDAAEPLMRTELSKMMEYGGKRVKISLDDAAKLRTIMPPGVWCKT